MRRARLGELCTIEKGNTGINKAIPGKYPLVVTGGERKSHNEYQFDGDAVIIPLVSSTGHGHKSLKRIHFQKGKFAVGSILCAVIPKDKTKLSAEYLYRYLDLNREKELVARMKGMANVTLPIKEIEQIEIPLPTLNEQHEFVKSYKELEIKSSELSSELTHQLFLVKQLRQAFLREAMQGKLIPQDPNDEPASELLKKIKAEKEQLIKEKKIKKEKELPPIKRKEIPFEIPESWTWCRLGEIALNVQYGTSERADMPSNNVPVLRMNNIQSGKIDLSSLKYVKAAIDDLPHLYLKNGDLLFNRTNSYELVGKSAVYHGKDDVMTFASYLIRVQFPISISVDFINNFINSNLCRVTQLEPEIIQQNGQANFNGTKLKNIICPFPPIKEQRHIVAKLEQLEKYCDDLEQSIKQSQIENSRLLQQVLRDALQPKNEYKLNSNVSLAAEP